MRVLIFVSLYFFLPAALATDELVEIEAAIDFYEEQDLATSEALSHRMRYAPGNARYDGLMHHGLIDSQDSLRETLNRLRSKREQILKSRQAEVDLNGLPFRGYKKRLAEVLKADLGEDTAVAKVHELLPHLRLKDVLLICDSLNCNRSIILKALFKGKNTEQARLLMNALVHLPQRTEDKIDLLHRLLYSPHIAEKDRYAYFDESQVGKEDQVELRRSTKIPEHTIAKILRNIERFSYEKKNKLVYLFSSQDMVDELGELLQGYSIKDLASAVNRMMRTHGTSLNPKIQDPAVRLLVLYLRRKTNNSPQSYMDLMLSITEKLFVSSMGSYQDQLSPAFALRLTAPLFLDEDQHFDIVFAIQSHILNRTVHPFHATQIHQVFHDFSFSDGGYGLFRYIRSGEDFIKIAKASRSALNIQRPEKGSPGNKEFNWREHIVWVGSIFKEIKYKILNSVDDYIAFAEGGSAVSAGMLVEAQDILMEKLRGKITPLDLKRFITALTQFKNQSPHVPAFINEEAIRSLGTRQPGRLELVETIINSNLNLDIPRYAVESLLNGLPLNHSRRKNILHRFLESPASGSKETAAEAAEARWLGDSLPCKLLLAR